MSGPGQDEGWGQWFWDRQVVHEMPPSAQETTASRTQPAAILCDGRAATC
ncbi:MAG TPA: hypothetical protein VF933_19345 [Streptosporangiaceae bacterium]